jgi:plastocyanin
MVTTRKRGTTLAMAMLLPAALWVGCGGAPETGAPPAPAKAPESKTEAPAATPPSAAPPSGSATILGTITYQGEVPSLPPVSMSADPACAAKHQAPVPSDVLVLGSGNTVGNVFVKVKSGLPDKQWPTPKEPIIMDQKGCHYDPHVMGVMVNQPFKVLNSDGILHNVHALPKVNPQFNMAMPASRTEAVEDFAKVEGMFVIKCDVHPWMKAYVEVLSHPFFDVTGPDGTFRIAALPAGTYEIEAWHEKLGTRTASVTVADGATGSADFTFSK